MNCSAMPKPHAMPAPHEAARPCQSRQYSVRDESLPSISGWYRRERLDPQDVKKNAHAMKKNALYTVSGGVLHRQLPAECQTLEPGDAEHGDSWLKHCCMQSNLL